MLAFQRICKEIAHVLYYADGYALFFGAIVSFYVGLAVSQNLPRYQYFVSRIGVLVFAACFAIPFFIIGNGYLEIVLRAVLFAASATGVLWGVGPLFLFLHRILIVPPALAIRRFVTSFEAAKRSREEVIRERERLANSEVEARTNAEREARRREQQELQRRQEEEKARTVLVHKQLRAQARAECERVYSLHESEIAGRFPRALFLDYLKRHLSDEQPLEYVESQASELKKLIDAHRMKVDPPKKLRTLGELAQWFEEQERELELVSDEKLRRSLLVQLKSKYAELSSQLMDQIG